MASDDLHSDSSDEEEEDDDDNGGVETSLPADPAVEVAAVAPRSKQQLKVDAKAVRQWKANHILEAGLAISERREATLQVIEREVLAEFKRRVDKDPNASSSQKATMLLAQQQKEITGGRVWKRFKEIKKIISHTFMPLLKDPIDHSGWDWIACFEDLRRNLWVKEGKEKKTNKEVRDIKDCPDSFEPVEFYAFKTNHTHPKLAGRKGAAKIGADGNSGDDSFRSQLSSRKQQRTEATQRERKKKRATIAENNSNSSSQEHSLLARKIECYENVCYMSLLTKAHGAGRPGMGVMIDKFIAKVVLPRLQSPAGVAPANMENDSDTVEVVQETTSSPILPRRVAAMEAEEVNLANAHPAERASLCVAGVSCKRENPRIKLGELSIMCFECVSSAHPSCCEMTEMSEDATVEFVCSICITKMKEDEVAGTTNEV